MATIAFFGPGSEWFWQMLQCFVVVLTGLFVVRQIQLQGDSHIVNSFTQLNQRWNSQLMLTARRIACEHYRPDNKSIDQASGQVAMFFEEVGAYCRRGRLNRDLLWELFSFDIEHYWPILENNIVSMRKHFGNDLTYYHHFERLHRDMLRISKKKGAGIGKKTQEDIRSFVAFELGVVSFLESKALDSNKTQTELRRKPVHLPTTNT